MINKVTLLGRLARDPESRNFANGGMVCNLRVLTSRNWKDRNSGERVERTEGHNIAIFAEPTAKYASQYAKKGDLVYLEGSLETRKWQDQSGQDRYTTEVVIRPYEGEFRIVPTGRSEGRGDGRAEDGSRASGFQASSPAPKSSSDSYIPQTGGSPAPSDLDDEIPF